MRFGISTYLRRYALTLALLSAGLVLVAVVACAAEPAQMSHGGTPPCVATAHGNAGNLAAQASIVVPSVAAAMLPARVVVPFASRVPARLDVAFAGVPPDDPLHGLLLL